jgi:glycosyltransferase involved in cell wall biosynthesis
MKILYDHQMFSLQRYGGITKYFCEIISNIPPEHQFELSVLFSDNYHLRERYKLFGKKNILPKKNFRKKEVLQKMIYNINQYYSKYRISANHFDLFHPTFYNDYFFKVLKKPYIITVHDLIEFKFKDASYQSDSIRPHMEKTIRGANRIIAISENTKKDIIDIFGIDSAKIDVIYHGYNTRGLKTSENKFGRYILFVGNRSRYKNFKIFAEAVSSLLKKERDVKLICVGPPFKSEEMSHLKTLNILDSSIAINVDEPALNNLYSNAMVFVYPSLYEGFGMPILEAFANNCPVCLSQASSFPEIAGNAGVYFDPNSQDSILAAIEKIIYNKDFALDIVKAGQARLMNFSWKKAAEETILSYQRTIS